MAARASHRQPPAVTTALPASDGVPAISSPRLIRVPSSTQKQRQSRADVTRRDSRTARSISPAPGLRPPPLSTARCSTRPPYDRVPPSRTPSAPANDASTGPGIGAGVLPRVLAPGAGGAARVPAGQHREYGGQPGTRPADQIVEPGRGPAEPQIPGRPVADHRVEGVHRTEAGQAGDAAEGAPDQRADHRVEVFSATDSTPRGASCCSSRACGSRPHRCGRRCRPLRCRLPPARRRPRGPPDPARYRHHRPGGGGGQRERGAGAAAYRTPGQRRDSHRAPGADDGVQRPPARWSRHRRRSRLAAARPKAATGCPRRGSPVIRSAGCRWRRRTRIHARHASGQSGRCASAGLSYGWYLTASGNRQPRMAKSSLRVSAPWFDGSGGESSWLPGCEPR